MSWLETGTNMLYVLFMFYYFPSLCFDRLQVTEYHCFFSDNFYFYAFVNNFKVYILQLLYVNVQSLHFFLQMWVYNLQFVLSAFVPVHKSLWIDKNSKTN
jgi:hypothetical protein